MLSTDLTVLWLLSTYTSGRAGEKGRVGALWATK